MKPLLIIVTIVLVVTAAGSGYYIFSLNGQINNLETELAGSIDQINKDLAQNMDQIDQVNNTLSEQIKDSTQSLTAAINDTSDSLDDYMTATGQKLTNLTNADAANSGKINSLENKAVDIQNQVNTLDGSVLQSSALYEQVKDAIVQISDGNLLYGSGVIVSIASGSNTYKYVVTAYHVVDGMPAMYMTRGDGLTWKASFFVGSEQADVAILGFDSMGGQQDLTDFKNFPSVKLADSSQVKPGDPVFVLGSPGFGDDNELGLKDTLTTGVISQVNRGITIGSQYYADLLQYDVAVNPGNSGGPLINANGEVIGLVNARIGPTYGDGISWAVASNLVRNICLAMPEDPVSMLMEGSSSFNYQYPSSGLTLKDVFPINIFVNGNTVTSGATVTAITAPASATGIRAGDIIVSIDGHEILDTDGFFSYLVENYSVGDTVTLQVIRNGEAISFALTIAADT
jgi:serine protease Do